MEAIEVMAFYSSTVAIAGGGASGLLVAAHLLDQATHPIRVLLYEPREKPGTGVAYGTNDVAHLLNVPAARMSALPENPAHFLDWLNAPSNCASLINGGNFEPADFVPRAIYARYLASVLDECVTRGHEVNALFEHRRDEVVDFIPRPGGGTLVTKAADTEDVAHIVLALGNLPPRDPLSRSHPFFSSSRYVSNVWRTNGLDRFASSDDLLIVGSGLTALDVVSSLQGRNHSGKIFITSRNGRFPQVHEMHPAYPDFLDGQQFPGTIRRWLRLVRQEVGQAAKAGVNWRPVFDALRPHTQKIWAGLGPTERRRFLRHLRGFWESHRHRVPARTWQTLEALREKGQVEFVPGRIRNFEEGADGVLVSLQTKGSATPTNLEVAGVINCIGPESNFRHRLNSPLIVNLMARGILHPDELYLGVNATSEGVLLGSDGLSYPQISTLGPPLRGVLWETTAMPEIRVQAGRLASRILDGLHVPAWQI